MLIAPADPPATESACTAGPAVVRAYLAHLRTESGLTWSELVERSGMPPNQLMDLQRTPAVPSRPQLASYLDALGAGAHLPALGALAGTAGESVTDRLPGWAERLSCVLARATAWRAGGGAVVPLGLRTARYHDRWARTEPAAVPGEEGEVLAALAGAVPPPVARPTAYLDEVHLHRPAGDTRTAAEQLDHLTALTERVDLRIVEAPDPGGAFVEIVLPGGDTLVVEARPDAARYHCGAAAAEARLVLDTLSHRAAPAHVTAERLRAAAQWMRVRTAAGSTRRRPQRGSR
ncbi:Scr1 family TA system antitoxin-like transcriptional regulator [Kitasatospora purpeofusca]|uniref:Scr1 family TA system antitoxin-like transcriptional regulator n=1 Tax=Kitasatospora purpeofusca TaxID=67352 RepID=UPI0035E07A71